MKFGTTIQAGHKVRRATIGRWHFALFPLSHWKLGWRHDKWDAGSAAIGKFVLTYFRQYGK